jgi:hypothetical protein
MLALSGTGAMALPGGLTGTGRLCRPHGVPRRGLRSPGFGGKLWTVDDDEQVLDIPATPGIAT